MLDLAGRVGTPQPDALHAPCMGLGHRAVQTAPSPTGHHTVIGFGWVERPPPGGKEPLPRNVLSGCSTDSTAIKNHEVLHCNHECT